ncbi:MAG TPA: helix-turn-helix transcriptional regulator [Chitinophagaceae bacterium]|jgi:putative transcriptional regulator|nr:helix-turn-helix transcriptional regulator [Chitinophagaceae bacterium]HPH32980.1 helix-turn-helix transcriptional regulator [Chitinophagaceae bacterium]HPN59900.1 helix-turn-helix transcriptional regulator [Chitinophagaceae bacterium]
MKNKVKDLRTEKGMTQQELADAIGVSRQTIFAMETSRYVPSTILALKLAMIFRKKVEDLFELEKKD